MAWKIADENHEGKAFVAIILLLIIVDFFCIFLRLYTQYSSGKIIYYSSNYVLIFAFIMTIGVGIVIYATFSHGYGQDISEFTLDDIRASSKLFPATEITWNAATTAVRISMILLYRQLLDPIRSFRIVCLGMITLNIINFVVIFIASLTICRPLSYIYDRQGPGHCGDIKAFESYTAVMSIVLDSSVVVMPLPLLWKLQMDTRKKVGLTVILSLGTIICALTVFRLVMSYVYETTDITKQSAIVDVVTGLEPTLGIIIACMPFLPGITKRATSRTRQKLLSVGFIGNVSSSTGKHSDRLMQSEHSRRPFERLEDTELDYLTNDLSTNRTRSKAIHPDAEGSENRDFYKDGNGTHIGLVRSFDDNAEVIHSRKDIIVREDPVRKA